MMLGGRTTHSRRRIVRAIVKIHVMGLVHCVFQGACDGVRRDQLSFSISFCAHAQIFLLLNVLFFDFLFLSRFLLLAPLMSELTEVEVFKPLSCVSLGLP